MPRVVRTEAIRGTWDPDQDRVGDRRRVVLDDGHFAAEEVLVDEPRVFRYIVWGYTNDAGLMIDHAIGEFSFEDEGSMTHLTWSYSFQPRSAIVRPLLANFVGGPWAGLMRATLQVMREGGEHQAPARPDRRLLWLDAVPARSLSTLLHVVMLPLMLVAKLWRRSQDTS